jgi:hypothetical protein
MVLLSITRRMAGLGTDPSQGRRRDIGMPL